MGVGGFDSFLGVFRVLGPEISCVFFGFTTLNPTPPGLRLRFLWVLHAFSRFTEAHLLRLLQKPETLNRVVV